MPLDVAVCLALFGVVCLAFTTQRKEFQESKLVSKCCRRCLWCWASSTEMRRGCLCGSGDTRRAGGSPPPWA